MFRRLALSVFVFTTLIPLHTPLAGAVGPWPSHSEWAIVTQDGDVIVDREGRGSCTDPTNGGAAPSNESDIASQADCMGGGTHYNPGLVDTQFGSGLQPGATNTNTYSAAGYYRDANGDSNVCANLSDDLVFFRIRVADNPIQNVGNGLKTSLWWATLDIDSNGIIDFYVRVDGNGNAAAENISVLYETSGDNDPTGEPVIATHLNPLNTGYARAIATPDNGTVGDATEYFLDWQIPVTEFQSNLAVQILCEGNSVRLTNYSTSANANDPFQKDRIMGLGTFSDPFIASDPEYQITKTATDVNGGALEVGDAVEYVITATNLGSNLNNFVFTDPIPVGGTYVPGSIKVTLDATEYTMTDAADSPDAGGCTAATNCVADFNITTLGAITVKNDWIYASGSVSPQYDDIIIKFRVTFAAIGVKSNQGVGTTLQLSNGRLTDDPGVDDSIDCILLLTDNCLDGNTGNDDPTLVTVVAAPVLTDLAITKSDGILTIIPGNSLTYTIVATNIGPNPVVGATVSDVFPPSLSSISWSCVASVGSSCTGAGVGNISDSAVNLLVGGTATYTVLATTDVNAFGLLTNIATVSVPLGMLDPVPLNNTATDIDTYTPTDFGDAPDPSFPTLLVNSGASHLIVPLQFLGSSIDNDPDGQPNATSTGDDTAGIDDEDGVSFTSSIIPGASANVTVTASVAGFLNAWMDFNNNGSWADPGEQIFTNQLVILGPNLLSFAVPPAAVVGTTTSRFRFNLLGGLSYTGPAIDGEVEDYQATIIAPPATPDLSTSLKSDDDVDNNVSNGQTVTYTITVKNIGGQAATGVSVTDTIDSNLENLIVTSIGVGCGTPTDSSTSTMLNITGVSVAVGVDCVITFTADVKMSAPGGAMINNTANISSATEGGAGGTPSSDTLIVITVPDLSTSTKTDNDSDDIVEPFQTYVYTITITNTGNGTGTGISVDDTLDSDLENLIVLSFTNCGAPINNSTSTVLDIDNVTVAVGVDCVITFSVRVIITTPGGSIISNTATISAAAEGGSGASPSSPDLTVATTPDLSTSTKTDDDADNNVANSQTITYTITISNTGNGLATGVDVDDSLDADLENLVVSSLTNCGGSYTDNSTSTVLDIDDVEIAVGVDCVIIFTADVTASAPGGSIIPNQATISQADEGGNGANPSSDLLAVDSSIIFFGSTKQDSDADNFIQPGVTVTYTIEVDNSGNANASGVSVTDVIDTHFGAPFNFQYTNCGSPTDNFTDPTLTFSNVDVNAFSTCEISYDVTVDSPIIDPDPESITITNSADIVPANGSTTMTADTLTIDVTPDLSTSTKTDNDGDNEVIINQVVTFSITINNTGDGTGTGISVDDVLDPNFGNLNVISINNCGTSYVDSSTAEPPVLDIDGILVDPGTPCVIIFSVVVQMDASESFVLNNQATITAATEGGNGANPSSDTLNFDITGEPDGGGGGGGRPRPRPRDLPEIIDHCIAYNGSRDLFFTDLQGVIPEYVTAAEILKESYQTATGDYVVSGYNSFRDDVGVRVVGLNNRINRLEWAKMLMMSHCLRVFDAMDLPTTTYNGRPMPHFADLPLVHNGIPMHDWQVDVMYSAAYYGLVEGTLQNNIELARLVTVAEAVKMVVRVREFISKELYPRDDSKVASFIDRNAWYFEFYSRASNEGIFQDLINQGVSENTVIRGQGMSELVNALLKRRVYITDDQPTVDDRFELYSY